MFLKKLFYQNIFFLKNCLSFETEVIDEDSDAVPTNAIEREVKVNIYYPPTYESYLYENRKRDFGDMIHSIVADIQKKVNSFTLKGPKPVKVKYSVDLVSIEDQNIPLDGCYKKTEDLTNVLNNFHTNAQGVSSIVLLNCDPVIYGSLFEDLKLNIEIVTLNSNISCSRDSLIFVYKEYEDTLLSLATSLLMAAGAYTKNPVSVREVINGDEGVKYKLLFDSRTIEEIREDVCGLEI